MPYIAVKAYPKDEETKRKVAEEINQVFLKYWGCPQQAISISMEEVEPAEWETKVRTPEILPKLENMLILDGEKKF